MKKTLKEIAEFIGGEVVGNEDLIITGVCGIKEAVPGDLTFLSNLKYQPFMDKTGASAIITSLDITSAVKPIIRVENPSVAFTKAVALFSSCDVRRPAGIHETAFIGKEVTLGKDVALGPYVVVEDNVSIGDNTVIYSGTFIGHHSKIGVSSLIYPNVSIREYVEIGSRVVIQSGTVIGSDGFGFVNMDGIYQRIPQIGIVVIEDDVEIGANVTIDRARFEKTVIGKGTKIDNLVQIAHNVIIGESSVIVAQVGIAGSARLGKGVTVAGQAGVAGHICVGDGAIVAGKAGATKDVPANTFVSGFPARNHKSAIRVNACMQNLPRLFEKVAELTKKINELELKLKSKGC